MIENRIFGSCDNDIMTNATCRFYFTGGICYDFISSI